MDFTINGGEVQVLQAPKFMNPKLRDQSRRWYFYVKGIDEPLYHNIHSDRVEPVISWLDMVLWATEAEAIEDARRFADKPPMTIEELEYLEVEGW